MLPVDVIFTLIAILIFWTFLSLLVFRFTLARLLVNFPFIPWGARRHLFGIRERLRVWTRLRVITVVTYSFAFIMTVQVFTGTPIPITYVAGNAMCAGDNPFCDGDAVIFSARMSVGVGDAILLRYDPDNRNNIDINKNDSDNNGVHTTTHQNDKSDGDVHENPNSERIEIENKSDDKKNNDIRFSPLAKSDLASTTTLRLRRVLRIESGNGPYDWKLLVGLDFPPPTDPPRWISAREVVSAAACRIPKIATIVRLTQRKVGQLNEWVGAGSWRGGRRKVDLHPLVAKYFWGGGEEGKNVSSSSDCGGQNQEEENNNNKEDDQNAAASEKDSADQDGHDEDNVQENLQVETQREEL